MPISDDGLRSIAEEIHRGNRELLAQEYANLREFIVYTMRTFPIDPMIKEDLFHNKLVDFIRICRSPQFNNILNWSAFLSRMSYNACLDHLRRVREQPLETADLSTDPQIVASQETSRGERDRGQDYIFIVLGQLDEEDVVILFKVLLQGERQNRIAEEKGWSPPRLNYRFRTALGKLKKKLGYLADQYDPKTLGEMVFQASVRYIREHELEIEIEL